MKWAWSFATAFVAFVAMTVLGDLASHELRERLRRLPEVLLALAAHRLPVQLRADRLRQWRSELRESLRGTEALPVTQLWRGLRYSAGVWWTAPRPRETGGWLLAVVGADFAVHAFGLAAAGLTIGGALAFVAGDGDSQRLLGIGLATVGVAVVSILLVGAPGRTQTSPSARTGRH